MKNKKVFIINGSGGVGKDSFVELCSKYATVKNISTVDRVKVAGRILGWNGKKTEEDREFLSDLKLLAGKYYNHSFNYVLQEYLMFMEDRDQQLMFIHCREPENIKTLKQELKCLTILISNENVEQILSNMADANVQQYVYDYYIKNDGTLEDLENTAKTFVKQIV